LRLTHPFSRLLSTVLIISTLISFSEIIAQGTANVDEPRLFPVQRNGKWGFIDSTGSLVIALKYDGAQDFREGLAPARMGRQWGYIDRTGELVIPPKYSLAVPFSDSLALVKMGPEDMSRFIDHTGREVVTAAVVQAWSYSEGILPVQMDVLGAGLKWGYFDKSGQLVIPARFDQAHPFSCGLALVKEGDVFSFIDKSGKVAIKARFETAYPFKDGLALVQVKGKWGCIDMNGGFVIRPQYDRLDMFSEDRAAARIGRKCCYLGRGGQTVLELGDRPEITYCSSFQEGLALVRTADGWGFIDATGAQVIPAKYAEARSFSAGLAAVRVGDRWGFIDRNGKMVIEPRFPEPLTFEGGLAQERYLDRIGYIDKSGKYVWELTR